MIIGTKKIKEIQILDKENNLLASITDEDIIEEDSCQVVLLFES